MTWLGPRSWQPCGQQLSSACSFPAQHWAASAEPATLCAHSVHRLSAELALSWGGWWNKRRAMSQIALLLSCPIMGLQIMATLTMEAQCSLCRLVHLHTLVQLAPRMIQICLKHIYSWSCTSVGLCCIYNIYYIIVLLLPYRFFANFQNNVCEVFWIGLIITGHDF